MRLLTKRFSLSASFSTTTRTSSSTTAAERRNSSRRESPRAAPQRRTSPVGSTSFPKTSCSASNLPVETPSFWRSRPTQKRRARKLTIRRSLAHLMLTKRAKLHRRKKGLKVCRLISAIHMFKSDLSRVNLTFDIISSSISTSITHVFLQVAASGRRRTLLRRRRRSHHRSSDPSSTRGSSLAGQAPTTRSG